MSIGAVIVTYNRINLLKNAINSINKQSFLCDFVVIVNNNSDDGTEEYLNIWKNSYSLYDKYVVSLKENIGGSGGFNEGIKKALELNADWLFLSDDDVVFEENSFEQLNDYLTSRDCRGLSAVCISVKGKNGELELDHRSYVYKKGFHIQRYSVPKEQYVNDEVYIDSLSFVGSLINVSAIKKVGLPIRDFFIWHDDLEFSIRLKKYGNIILLPNIYINHHDDVNAGILYWKRYYGLRNYLIILKKHYPIIYILNMLKFIILYIPRLFTNKNKKDNKMINDVYHDAFFNKLGINYNYFPKK